MRWVWLGTVCGALSYAHLGAAQEPLFEEPLFKELQNKETLTPEDDKVLDEWLDKRLAELAVPVGNLPNDPHEQFVTYVRDVFAKTEVTDAFKDRLAARAAGRVAAVQGPASWTLVRALVEMNRVAILPGLQAGLSAKDATTRYWSAKGYRVLSGRLGQDPELVKSAITALQKAGVAEDDGVVIGEIYRALKLPAQPSESAEALLEIFKARTGKMAPGKWIRTRSEIDAYQFLNEQRAQLPEKTKVGIVTQLALFLKYDVDAYLDPQLIQQERIIVAERIFSGEDLLQNLVQPSGKAPELRTALKGTTDVEKNLAAELAKWIGAPDAPGLLNEAPWSVPVGAVAGS